MPIDVCTSCGERMPVAVCSVERCLSATLRRTACIRKAQATSVSTSAAGPLTARKARSSPRAASALASTKPDDRPLSAKLTIVSGCAHSSMNRRHA